MILKDDGADGIITRLVEHTIVALCKFPVMIGEKLIWIIIQIPKGLIKIIKFPIELLYRLGLRFVKYGIKKLTPQVIQNIVEEETKIYDDYKKQNKLKHSSLGRTKLDINQFYRKLRGKTPLIIQENRQKKRKLYSPKVILDKFRQYREYRKSYKKRQKNH